MNKEVPKNWKIYKLKDITTMIKRGISPKYVEDSGYIVVNQKCIRNGELSFKDAKMTDKLSKIPDEKFLQNGDILVNSTGVGTLGRVASFLVKDNQIKITADSHVSIARPKLDVVDSLYLKYYLQKHQSKIETMASGSSGQLELSRKSFENMNIPVPERIEEQQEIVQVLDTMSDIIRLREECISHAQALIPALFQEMFEQYIHQKDKHVSIGSVTSDTKQINPSKIFDTDFYYIDIASINNDTGIIETPKIININDAPSRARKLVQANDVIISMTRPYLKGFSIVPERLDGQIASTGFSVLRSIPEKLSPLYLFAYARTDMFVEQLIPKMKGANYPAVRDSDVRSVKIPLPPIELQEQFAQKVNEIESYIKEQDEELKNAEQMFKSLIHHAFTGELTRHKFGGDANG